MKKALRANEKISKDAKETVQECVSEFISFIIGQASDKCQREKRKTINDDDLLWAMTTHGLEEYVEPLKVYLTKYRETEGEKTSIGGEQKDDTGGVSSMYDSGGGMQSSMMMMGAQPQAHHQQQQYYNNNKSQGQMYGSGSFHQMSMGVGGKGNSGSGSGGGASTVRPSWVGGTSFLIA